MLKQSVEHINRCCGAFTEAGSIQDFKVYPASAIAQNAQIPYQNVSINQDKQAQHIQFVILTH